MKVFLSHLLLLMIIRTVAVNATGRITVGSANAIYTGVDSRIYYCEPDNYIENNVIFAERSSLHTTDGVTSSNIAGSSQSGYSEGVGISARFRFITGLYQWNDTVVVASDYANHCLRYVFRDTNQTGTLTGNCTHSGSADGVGKEAHFHYPIDVILDHTDTGVLLTTDRGNNAIRSINMESLFVSTVANIANPEEIEWSEDNSTLYVLHYSGGTSSINWDSKEVTRLISDSSAKPYNQIFYDAIDQDQTDFAHLYGPYFVIVHADLNDTVRIVNMQERQGWELCIGTSSNCSFDARSVNAHKNSLLIGSDDGSITQYSGFDCTLEPACPEGTLVNSDIGCLCQCPQGYTGPNCESFPCVHGACTDLVDDFSCECEEGYQGKTCALATATDTTPPKGSNSSIIITGIGVGCGALAVLVITLLLIIVWQRGKIQRIQRAEISPAITMSGTSVTVSTANDSVQQGTTRGGVPINRMTVDHEYSDIREYESLATVGESSDNHVYSQL